MLPQNKTTRCKGGEGSSSRRVWRVMAKLRTRAQRFPKRRAIKTYSEKGESGTPTLGHNFAGRSKEASISIPRKSIPSIVVNAIGGIVVETHAGKLRCVEEGGDEAAYACNVCFVC